MTYHDLSVVGHPHRGPPMFFLLTPTDGHFDEESDGKHNDKQSTIYIHLLMLGISHHIQPPPKKQKRNKNTGSAKFCW